jgi:TfoX/Sxy family transcriptional regulator of competence genes
VAFVCEQLRGAGDISSKRMFGEAAVYLGDKVVGLICDNQLFIKPTDVGRARIGAPLESPPFPGASNWFLMTDLDDPEWLADLVRATADALPARKTKTKKKKKIARPAKKTPTRNKVARKAAPKRPRT